jgi:uncharacterized protein with PIN domain
MGKAVFHFHAGLNDFLPAERKGMAFTLEFRGHETVKHLIESAGVPHTEVDLILVDGEPVGFDRRMGLGDRVEVYPPGIVAVNQPSIHLIPDLPEEIRFLLDGHLGKLATYLRLLGFDTLYQNDWEDATLAEISSQDGCILLTRDRGLLKRSQVKFGYWVREKEPQSQVLEVVRRFELAGRAQPFSRCTHCNARLEPVEKEAVLHLLKPKTKRYYDDFHQCQGCGQVYWKGSHFDRMEGFINEILLKGKERDIHKYSPYST